jgi:hypothetical protein
MNRVELSKAVVFTLLAIGEALNQKTLLGGAAVTSTLANSQLLVIGKTGCVANPTQGIVFDKISEHNERLGNIVKLLDRMVIR